MKVGEPLAIYEKQYTYADYLNFTFEGMVEIIKGKIFKMSPVPRTDHQQISMSLSGEIYQYLKQKNCKVFTAPFDVILPLEDKINEKSTTVVQPDICVICNQSIIKPRGCFGVPDFIIEIISPNTKNKDLKEKYDVYEEAGVQEYWIVTPQKKCIDAYNLENGKYQKVATYQSNEFINSIVLQGLKIDLNEVFLKI